MSRPEEQGWQPPYRVVPAAGRWRLQTRLHKHGIWRTVSIHQTEDAANAALKEMQP
jgi:hypothetical protein